MNARVDASNLHKYNLKLSDPPPGYEWVGEVREFNMDQTYDPFVRRVTDRSYEVRIVFTLHPITGYEPGRGGFGHRATTTQVKRLEP